MELIAYLNSFINTAKANAERAARRYELISERANILTDELVRQLEIPVSDEEKKKWKERLTPNQAHPYYGVRTLHDLKMIPGSYRIAGQVRIDDALSGKAVAENIATALSFYRQAEFAKELYQELTEEV